MTRAPKEVRCNWKFHRVFKFKDNGDVLHNIWHCADCDFWTGNIGGSRYDVCEKKDRRKGQGKADRRNP